MATNSARERVISKVMAANKNLGKLLVTFDFEHQDDYDAGYIRALSRAMYEMGVITYEERDILVGDATGTEEEEV